MLSIARHRQIMFEIIQDIYRQPQSKDLVFKGGTMLYFFYKLPRFSVDLDFDLLDKTKLKSIDEAVEDVLKSKGRLVDKRNKHFTLFYLLNYERGERNLKVEISKRLFEGQDYEIRNFYGVDVKIHKIEDAVAHKMVAVMERKGLASRDFFDIYWLLKQGYFPNNVVIKKRTGQELVEYVGSLIKYIEKELRSRQTLVGLGELLNQSQKDWARGSLKKELLKQLRFFQEELVNFKSKLTEK